MCGESVLAVIPECFLEEEEIIHLDDGPDAKKNGESNAECEGDGKRLACISILFLTF